jgi:undecaprenol kinase
MDSQDKQKPYPLLKTFSFAFSGILSAIRTERNMRFHLLSSIVVLFFSFYFSLTKLEWITILFAVGGMFAFELMNTAIEKAVDLVTEQFHPLAKQAKDLAAGAVLMYAILSSVVGGIIFIPYILKLFK